MQKITGLHKKAHTKRGKILSRGFSLIELLIVIAIIGLFSILSFNVLRQQVKKPKAYTVEKLRKIFGDALPADKELICIDKCSKCFTTAMGGGAMHESASNLKDMKAYTLDASDNPQEIDFGRFNDHPICLRFRYYANGSNTQIILETEDKFFYFPTYFGKVEVFDSLEDATDKWKSNTKLVSDKGKYY